MDANDWDLTQLVAPAGCLNCDDDGGPLCKTCMSLMETAVQGGCHTCGNPTITTGAQTCNWCRRLDCLPQDIATGFAYREEGQSIYRKVKFQGYWRLIDRLVSAAMPAFFQIPFLQYAALLPIPDSLWRRLTRNFNPAYLIARSLSQRTSLPVCATLKTRAFAKRQLGLDYAERRRNGRNRFALKSAPPSSVILVDDVLTTGATLEAATRSLQSAGVHRIAWFTLFRTL